MIKNAVAYVFRKRTRTALIFLILMDQSYQAYHALFRVMMCSWLEIKRISYLNQ